MDTALESIKLLPAQIRQVWEEIDNLEFPEEYKQAKNIAISGMGGSIYNFFVLNALYCNALTVPLIKINNYGLPSFLNQESLLIGSSYSGTTEEVLYNTEEGVKKGLRVFIYSAGGPLVDIAEKNRLAMYQFNPTNNPSGQPRMGQGYMLFSAIKILAKLGYLKADLGLIFLDDLEKRLPEIEKEASSVAKNLLDKEIFYVASDHLAGNAHILRNQTNETAKLYSDYNLVPELNHHLMEGLKHPAGSKRAFVFLDSSLYFQRNQQRMTLTKDVIEKNKYPVFDYRPKATSPLGQFTETLVWGGYLTYALGKDYNEDPNSIPWVDYFKKNLGHLN